MSFSAFHGIGAYRGQKNPVALSRQLTTAMSGVEICVADRPIGAFGAVFEGHCRATFERDVWSQIGEDGLRYIYDDYKQDSYQFDNQRDYNAFCRRAMYWESEKHYTESWMSVYGLRAVWVKDWADEKTKRAACIIAKHRGVKLIVVKGNTRIWQVMDFYDLALKIQFNQ